MKVGKYNTTGRKYQGHYSIWITNHLQERLLYLDDMLENPLLLDGWINGNLYEPTTETIGILAVPESLRHDYNMAGFDDELADKKQKHRYLAQMQGTRKAILPVHTEEEKKIFRDMMADSSVFAACHWKKAAPKWNERAETNTGLFYKVYINS